MIFEPEITLGNLIETGSFLVATIALSFNFYQLRRDAIRNRTEFTIKALMKQLDTLTRIQAMPEDRRDAIWAAIASAPGGPGLNFPIEKAIAIQMRFLDLIAQSKEITTIPTYGQGIEET